MSIETSSTSHQDEEPKNNATNTEGTIPHSGVHGYEKPVDVYDKTSLKEAHDADLLSTTTAPSTTGELPPHLQVEVNDTKKSRKGLLIGLGAGATSLALVAAAFFAGKGSSDDKEVTPRLTASPSATASANPGPSESLAPAPPTKEMTPEEVAKTAESLTIGKDLYSADAMKTFRMPGETELKLSAQYPNYSSVLSVHDRLFHSLTSEQLIAMRDEYTKLLNAETYDTESVKQGDPKKISLAEFMTAPANGGGKFPSGWPKTAELQDYATTASTHPELQPVTSLVAMDAFNNTYHEPQTNWMAENENAIKAYNDAHPTGNVEPALKPSVNVDMLLSAQYADQSSDFAREGALNRTKDFLAHKNVVTPLDDKETYLVTTLHNETKLGANTVNIEGFMVVFTRADTKAKYVETVVLVPLESYIKDGKLVNEPYLQPVVLSQSKLSAL